MFARNVDACLWGPKVNGNLGLGQVNDYRVYVMDHQGHVVKPPEIVSCDTDEEAMLRAKQYLDGRPIEIWLGAKRVGRLEPDSHQ